MDVRTLFDPFFYQCKKRFGVLFPQCSKPSRAEFCLVEQRGHVCDSLKGWKEGRRCCRGTRLRQVAEMFVVTADVFSYGVQCSSCDFTQTAFSPAAAVNLVPITATLVAVVPAARTLALTLGRMVALTAAVFPDVLRLA